MSAKKLKKYIKEDAERIEKALEYAGCHKIWSNNEEVRGAPPSSENHTAIAVNTETLYSTWYREGETFRGDIIGLIQEITGKSFKEVFRGLCNVLGFKTGGDIERAKANPLQMFMDIRKGQRKTVDIEEIEVAKFGNEALTDFVESGHLNLFNEGILVQVQERFRVCYDPNQDRILFPHFAWDDKDAIVGITGRTLRSKEEMEKLKIPKYWNYLKGYKKSYNLYNFSHAIKRINQEGKLILFEAEKSSMKHACLTGDYGFGLAVGGHEISNQQVQIILKHTDPSVEIVIAFDKDVMKDEQYLINCCEKFSKYRKTSYIFDKYDILGEKDAPIDNYKKWMYLYEHRIQFS